MTAALVLIMNRILLLFAITILYSCGNSSGLPSGLRGNGFGMGNDHKHKKMLAALEKSGIPFTVSGKEE